MQIGDVALHVDEKLTTDGRLLVFVMVPGLVNITLALDRAHAYEIARKLIRPYVEADTAAGKAPPDADTNP